MASHRRLVLLALVTGALALVPVVALAWPGGDGPRRLVLGFELRFTGPTSTEGTFVASGAVRDAGASTVADLALEPTGGRDRARLSGKQTFAGAQGTIVTRFEGIARGVSGPHQWGKGRFRIVSATGAYAGLRGRGSFLIVVDAAGNRLIGTEEGRVH